MSFQLFSEANYFILTRWSEPQTPENETLRRLRMEVHFFIWRTGQVYRLEAYRQRRASESTTATVWGGEYGERMMGVQEILTRIRDSQQSPEEQLLVQVGLDEIDFLASTGQQDEFYDYLKTYYRNPPPVMARFATRQEAEEWLVRLTEPPSNAHVLVGDDYFELFYDRDRGVRALTRDYALERFIEAVTSRGLPSPVATFASRDEAEAWWTQHPNPPISAWVQIADEHHLAINHRKIAHRTLHPISILKGWEEEKKRIDEIARAQQAEDTADTED